MGFTRKVFVNRPLAFLLSRLSVPVVDFQVVISIALTIVVLRENSMLRM